MVGRFVENLGVGVLGFCGCGVLKVQGAWAFCLSGFHGKTSERISWEDSWRSDVWGGGICGCGGLRQQVFWVFEVGWWN